MDINKIKLIIWDLDDTFWSGTLSEGGIIPIEKNIQLIKDLTDYGIVNSICSKNDYEPTEKKLKELDINDYFVFKSIDWSSKGQRITKIINDMGLRPINCLFIDDNVVNLNEAKFYNPDLIISQPHIIDNIISDLKILLPNDKSHNRLNQYKVLEKKQEAKENSDDNLSFLWSTNTKVNIHNDCISQLERITELVNRTNQLNFTKLRTTKDELQALLENKDINAGYVTVKDNFGDYGIVGFYAIKENKCIHFLFSCRTIGQGVEQYVYSILGWPELSVVGEVINNVKKIEAPKWINQENNELNISSSKKSNAKIIFKGACDLRALASFLKADNIIEEFTYIGLKQGNSIEHHNHSINYLRLPFLSEEEKNNILKDCIFNDEEMFDTRMYDKDVSLIFLSTQIEPNLGIYRNKKTGYKIAWGEYKYPLTDSNNWEKYINGKIFNAGNKFTLSWFKNFSDKYEFIGRLTPSEFIENLETILSKIQPNAKICLLLGSEIPYEANTQEAYADRHLYYKEINDLLKEYSKKNKRVLLLDFNNYIKGQSSFTDNINHYQRIVYYEASHKANEYIENSTGSKVQEKEYNKLFFAYDQLKTNLKRKINRSSIIYKIISRIYFNLRKK